MQNSIRIFSKSLLLRSCRPKILGCSKIWKNISVNGDNSGVGKVLGSRNFGMLLCNKSKRCYGINDNFELQYSDNYEGHIDNFDVLIKKYGMEE